MTKYNTGDPVGSPSVKNLYDNAENLDHFVNDKNNETWSDRLGHERITYKGMENQFNQSIEQFNLDADAAIRAAGYVLLDSFQQGVKLPNNEITLRTQALRDDRNGEYYRWNGVLPKKVPPGSTPESTGGAITPEKPTGDWIGVSRADASDVHYSPVYSGVSVTVAELLNTRASSTAFGLVINSSIDQTVKLQNAIDMCFQRGMLLDIASGTYRATDTIRVRGGANYASPGNAIKTQGKGRVKIIFDNPTPDVAKPVLEVVGSGVGDNTAYNVLIDGISTGSTNVAATSHGLLVSSSLATSAITNCGFGNAISGATFMGDAWLNKFTNIMISCRDNGFIQRKSGTSNFFDRIFVYGTKVLAYRLSCTYSTVGSLAADECTGTIYNLDYFSGSINSLGIESPIVGATPSTLVRCDFGDVTINYIRGYRVVPTDGTPFEGVRLGSSSVTIGKIVLDKNDINSASNEVNGTLFRGYRGNLSLGLASATADHNDVSALPLTFTSPITLNTHYKISPPSGTDIAFQGNAKPYIGAAPMPNLAGIAKDLQKRATQRIFLDAAGGPNGSGYGENLDLNRDRYLFGAIRGDWMIEVDPGLRGCAGYAVTATGIDMNSTQVVRIPICQVVTTIEELPTESRWEGRTVFVRAVHKHLTYSTYGTAGWYDSAGVKIV